MAVKIAVVGTGTIGSMMGGFLAKNGYDVTVISMFRKETAQHLTDHGITVEVGEEVFTTPVKAVYGPELTPEDGSFDLVLLTGKSNDTVIAMETIMPFVTADGVFCSLQNGFNEDIIVPMVGAERVIPCICFAGGQMPQPGYVRTHEGRFIIGELSGMETPRVLELAKILSCAKDVTVSDHVLIDRWGKLAEVCMTVPVSTVSGYGLFGNNEDPTVQRVFGKLAGETFRVAEAAGFRLNPIMGLTAEEWDQTASEPTPELLQKFLSRPNSPPKAPGQGKAPAGPMDAYSMDIAKGLPLEVYYTNGYVVEKGKVLGIPTPTHEALLKQIGEIQNGMRKPCPENLAELIGV